MRVLELFCGLGGWSKPWIKAGHDVTGVDIKDLGYPGRFIKGDLFDLEFAENSYDVVLASPPCTEFSIAKKWGWGTQDERQGLDLVFRTFYLISKIKPKYFVVENVKGLAEFLPPPDDIVKYGSRNKHGKAAYLWGNFKTLGMLDFHQKFRAQTTKPKGANKTHDGARGIKSRKPQLISTCRTKAERGLILPPLANKMFEVMSK